jgi:NADH-quinone oxidoreductase subunit F
MPNLRTLTSQEAGTFPDVSLHYLLPTCLHCTTPGCVTVCPAEAITKRDEDGVIIVDIEKCKGPEACGHPCSDKCPAGINVLGFISQLQEGDYDAAWELITEANPLPGVTGRVCFHPCQSVCNRLQVDETIAIHNLERFISDNASRTPPPLMEPKNQTVAVVGSGPAGLSCAYHLARRGYQVTVFEALPVVGGMLRVGIPDYRLSRDILEREISFIKDTGVKIKTNRRLGDNLTFEELDRFDAVFLAIGALKDRLPDILGVNLKGVNSGLDFLREVNLNGKAKVGKRVLVIGGGNVAIDCARTTLRLGATRVDVACLESYDEMPADEDEVKQAQAEGVTIHPARAFCRITDEGGQASGVECLNLRSMRFDEAGELHFDAVEGSEHIIPADTIIIATGQAPDLSCLPSDIKAGKGIIEVDENGATSRKNYYAGGDAAVTIDRRRVSWAIGMGRRAAAAIDRQLQGLPAEKPASAEEDIEYKIMDTDFIEKKARVAIPELSLAKRKQGFKEVELGLEPETAIAEAKRCLLCQGMCLVACPYDAPQFISRAQTRMLKCNFCIDRLSEDKEPACVASCPVIALDAGSMEELIEKYGGAKQAEGFTNYPKTEPAIVFGKK